MTLATGAQAATIAAFPRSTNDGVLTLTAAQIANFGVSDATHVAFYRPRGAAGVKFAVGDTFNSAAVSASCVAGCGNILSVRNGNSPQLAYTCDFMDMLGLTTVTTFANGFVLGVAILFRNSFTMAGTSSYATGRTRGDFDYEPPAPPASVPLPAGLPLLLAALGGLGALARRRRAG